MSQSLLVKGFYRKEGGKAFGIENNQYAAPHSQIAHNGGWYNKFGESIGDGDLSPENINRISAEINEEELFIVLSESDSSTNESQDAPGIEYVANKCFMIISKDNVYVIPTFPGNYEESFDKRIHNCVWCSRKNARNIINKYSLMK